MNYDVWRESHAMNPPRLITLVVALIVVLAVIYYTQT